MKIVETQCPGLFGRLSRSPWVALELEAWYWCPMLLLKLLRVILYQRTLTFYLGGGAGEVSESTGGGVLQNP